MAAEINTYRLRGKITVACWTEVEAETLSQAMDIANNRDVAEIYTEDCECEFWNLGNDGTPRGIIQE